MAKVERQMEGRANSAHLLERSGDAVITENTPWAQPHRIEDQHYRAFIKQGRDQSEVKLMIAVTSIRQPLILL